MLKLLTLCLVVSIALGDHHLSEDSSKMDAVASEVAEALTRGLEDSVKDCKIDPADPKGSIQKCLMMKDIEELNKIHDKETKDASIAQKKKKHFALLKTAFLNLNEQLKNSEEDSDEEIAELLNKIDTVVKIMDSQNVTMPEVPESTVVEVPTDADIESAVISQNFDDHDSDFWSALFSVADKVALGLLLKIKDVPKDLAKAQIKKFLQGNDDERLRILGETLKLQKDSFDSFADDVINDLNKPIKRSGFIPYDSHGLAMADLNEHFEMKEELSEDAKRLPLEEPELIQKITIEEPLESLKNEVKHPHIPSEETVLLAKHTHRSMDVLDILPHEDIFVKPHHHFDSVAAVPPETEDEVFPKGSPHVVSAPLKSEDSFLRRHFNALLISAVLVVGILATAYRYRFKLRRYYTSTHYRRINTKSF